MTFYSNPDDGNLQDMFYTAVHDQSEEIRHTAFYKQKRNENGLFDIFTIENKKITKTGYESITYYSPEYDVFVCEGKEDPNEEYYCFGIVKTNGEKGTKFIYDTLITYSDNIFYGERKIDNNETRLFPIHPKTLQEIGEGINHQNFHYSKFKERDRKEYFEKYGFDHKELSNFCSTNQVKEDQEIA